jgi:integrase
MIGDDGCMNKKSITLTKEQYKESVELLRSGFMLNGVLVKPNERIATICVLQATLGLRLSDVLSLKMTSFVKDGGRYRLNIVEKKTSKPRNFTVPVEIYSFIQDYAICNNIGVDAKLFDITERQVQRHLNKVFTKMDLPLRSYGSHSYRKFFATQIYLNNDMNIELVRVLLQHSSVAITQRYIGISQKTVEEAIAKTVNNLV